MQGALQLEQGPTGGGDCTLVWQVETGPEGGDVVLFARGEGEVS